MTKKRLSALSCDKEQFDKSAFRIQRQVGIQGTDSKWQQAQEEKKYPVVQSTIRPAGEDASWKNISRTLGQALPKTPQAAFNHEQA